MGYLLSGLFGSVKNKIGGVVFSNWKGINTAREYKIPANPNSPAQQAQRLKFKNAVIFAQGLIGTLIATFWDPFAVKMSGFNYLIQSIFPGLSSTGFLTADCLVAKGTLESATLASATYNTLTGAMELDFTGAAMGNGLDTDKVACLIIDGTDNTVYLYDNDIGVRSEGVIEVSTQTGLTATDLVAFVWLYRGTGQDYVVSNSSGKAGAAL